MDHWRFVERVAVRRAGNAWVGEARTHANFAVGEILPTPAEALESAARAMDAQLRPIYEARQAEKASAEKAKAAPATMFEDLLG